MIPRWRKNEEEQTPTIKESEHQKLVHKEVDNIYTERHCFYTARVTIIKTYYADFMLTENVTLFSIA